MIICPRCQHKLAEATALIPGLITCVCDVADAEQCRLLAARIQAQPLKIDILMNNAAPLSFETFNKLGMDITELGNI